MIEEAAFIRRVIECAVVEMACDMATEQDYMWFESHLKLQEDHQQIFEAVRAKEPERAKELLCRHLLRYQVERNEIERVYSDLIKKKS